MIKEILVGITQELNVLFPNIPVATDEDQMQSTPPQFYVEALSSEQTRLSGNRFKRGHAFDIRYYPSSATEKNEEMLDVSDALYTYLDTVLVDSDRYTAQRMVLVDMFPWTGSVESVCLLRK